MSRTISVASKSTTRVSKVNPSTQKNILRLVKEGDEETNNRILSCLQYSSYIYIYTSDPETVVLGHLFATPMENCLSVIYSQHRFRDTIHFTLHLPFVILQERRQNTVKDRLVLHKVQVRCHYISVVKSFRILFVFIVH